MLSEIEEFEFRRRAEKEAAAAKKAAPPVVPKKGMTLEELKAAGVDTDIPSPEVVSAENTKTQQTLADQTVPQHAMDLTKGVLGGAAANMAAVPALGAAGRGLSLAGRAIPKLGEVGQAVTEIGGQMAKQGPKELALAGGAIGGAAQSVVDFLMDKYKMTEEAANNLVATVSTMTAAGGAMPWSKFIPQPAKKAADYAIEKTLGAGKDVMTEVQKSKLYQSLMDRFGGGGTIKEDTAPLSAALNVAAGKREEELRGQGKEQMDLLRGKAERAGRITTERMPSRIEQSRQTNLGPSMTKSDLADEVRMNVLPKAQAALTEKQQTGRAGWDALKNESRQKESIGVHVNDTKAAQDAVAYINSFIEPDVGGKRLLSTGNPLYKKLAGWKERIMGDVVEGGGKPKMRSLVGEIVAGSPKNGVPGGIDPSLLPEFSKGANSVSAQQAKRLFKAGGMKMDELVEYAEQRGWVSAAELAEADANKTGGSHDLVKSKILNEMNGQFEPHPRELDDYMKWQQSQGQKKRLIGMEEFDSLRRELKELSKITTGPTGKEGEIADHARRLEKMIAKAMDEHAPNTSNERLREYRDAVKDEEEYLTSLGKSISQRDPADPGQYKTASHTLVEKIFAGRDPAASFKRMIGGDQAEFDRIAMSHVSTELEGLNAAQAESWIKKGSYRDWSESLSPQAREKVEKYLVDLRKAEGLAKGAEKRGAEYVAGIKKIPGQTEQSVKQSTDTLLGDKKSVGHVKNLILTAKDNKEQMKQVYAAVTQQPGGKEAWKRSVEAVIKDEIAKNEGKGFLKVFDETIADTLLSAGTHSQEEVSKLRGIVKAFDELSQKKVATKTDFLDAIKEFTNQEVIKKSAWSAVAGMVSGAAAGAGVGHMQGGIFGSMLGGAVVGKEAAGYYSAGSYQRYVNRAWDLLEKVIADEELTKAALAEPTEGNIKKLMGMLAQKTNQGVVILGEEKAGERAKKAVGFK